MLKVIFSILGLSLASAAIVYFVLNAVAREAEFNNNIKKERCARMGANIPAALQSYCANTGV